jgi:hypothetical protein
LGDVAHLSEPSPEVPAWLLEVGAAARRAQFLGGRHAEQGHRLRAWSSGRAAARARRKIVRDAFAGGIPQAVEAPAPERFEGEQLELQMAVTEFEGREDTCEVPAIVLPAVEPELVEPEPHVVPLPPVQVEPELEVEPQLEGEPDATEDAVEPEEQPVSVLLDRIAAYTHGSTAAVS